MDGLLGGLLDNNLVEIEYLSAGRFPTRGLFTRHQHFMYHEKDIVEFEEGGFFQAYEILRRKKITILNEEEILGVSTYNPQSCLPIDLCLGVSQPIHSSRSTQIKKFLSACGPIASRGDPEKLNREEKLLFLEFFTGLVERDIPEDTVDELLADLRYMSSMHKVADTLQYGIFFGMDIDFETEEESIAYAASKWFSIIRVYGSLYLQHLDPSSPVFEAITDMRLPDPNGFESFEQVLRFWPYVLSPRPQEFPLL